MQIGISNPDIKRHVRTTNLCFAGRKATFRFEVAYAGDD